MKKLLAFTLFLLASCTISAQTPYYKLTKKIIDGKTYTNVSGGQFIRIGKKGCSDSDRAGNSVGNGYLTYQGFNGSVHKYYGDSYWGKAQYKFNYDKSVLNVLTSDGEIFVYKLAEAPSNKTTCSLIRNWSPTPNIYGTPNLQYGNNSGNSNDGSSVNKNRTSGSKRHTCSLCHGTGRIVYEPHVPNFGLDDPLVRCPECGKSFPRSWGHSHITCTQCHGKGYFTTD